MSPVITFDQPLWWKAQTIVANEPEDSPLKSVVVQIGGLHTEMSFLGCIGPLKENSGLCETLEVVYGSNAVTHMLSGKVLVRGRRGHILVDAALNIILVVADAFQVPLPVLSMLGTETKVVDTEHQDSVEAAKEEMTERGSPFQSSESDGHSESVVVHTEEYQDST